MRIHTVGDGSPEVAIIGGIHGDEPCGVQAIKHVLHADVSFRKPTKFIIANEQALSHNTRYIDNDLNRVFPGSRHAQSHEKQLAARLLSEIKDTTVLSLHSTQSYTEAFALVSESYRLAREIVPELPVTAAVRPGDFIDGCLLRMGDVIEVETGLQQSKQAVENAKQIIWAFLHAMDVIKEPQVIDRQALLDPTTAIKTGPRVLEESANKVPMFDMEQPIPKKPDINYTIQADNFKQVKKGEIYATAGEKPLVAERSFYPVLMSSEGYNDIIGFSAQRTKSITM